jgi:hypothetical protein
MPAPAGILFSELLCIIFFLWYLAGTHWTSWERFFLNCGFLCCVTPSAVGISRIRPASALPHVGPFSGNAWGWGCYPTQSGWRRSLRNVRMWACPPEANKLCLSLDNVNPQKEGTPKTMIENTWWMRTVDGVMPGTVLASIMITWHQYPISRFSDILETSYQIQDYESRIHMKSVLCVV